MHYRRLKCPQSFTKHDGLQSITGFSGRAEARKYPFIWECPYRLFNLDISHLITVQFRGHLLPAIKEKMSQADINLFDSKLNHFIDKFLITLIAYFVYSVLLEFLNVLYQAINHIINNF